MTVSAQPHVLTRRQRIKLLVAIRILESVMGGTLLAVFMEDAHGPYVAFHPDREKESARIMADTDWRCIALLAEEWQP